ncbi:MAG: TAXI family TRAP transporter solute-binding subunit [Desulfobacterales bacterium]|nr:TAXI family TRAP transporter solute-binding subunit [Desulfobacterales bacterium]
MTGKSIIPLLIILLFGGTATASARTFVTIGTGGVTGVYYPTGGAISRMINKKSKEYKIKATVESTAGSVYNINSVLSGELEFGVAQSDRQYQAYHGLAEWARRGPQQDLRSVFSIHPESITLVASAVSGVKTVRDLKGKRVNIGNPGSGQLQNSRDVLAAAGLSMADIHAEQVKAVEAPGLLQDEKIDAFFYTVGHPNGNIKGATSGRIKVNIIPINGPGIDALLARYPYYARSVIPADFYPNTVNQGDVETIGVKATLVTSRNLDEKIVYAVTREVFDNLDEFKKLHPAYSALTRENMLKGLSAPIHRGALRYYRETGLVKFIDPRLLP